jgi:putative transposase
MQWLMTSHVRRHHRAHKSGGHIWHGRYKSFIVQEDRHLLETVRYIEANPVRGRLVSSASEWPWSSHAERIGVAGPFVDTLPIPLPDSWSSHVDTPLSEIQLERIQTSVRRQTPFGAPHWQTRICRELDLESTITPKGRPRKSTLKTSLSPY